MTDELWTFTVRVCAGEIPAGVRVRRWLKQARHVGICCTRADAPTAAQLRQEIAYLQTQLAALEAKASA